MFSSYGFPNSRSRATGANDCEGERRCPIPVHESARERRIHPAISSRSAGDWSHRCATRVRPASFLGVSSSKRSS